MSGEQAGERTAREGRREELREKALRLIDVRMWETSDTGRADKLDAAEARLYSYELPQQILDLLSECSRLASRVEELEKGLVRAARRQTLCLCGGTTHAACPLRDAHRFWRCWVCDGESESLENETIVHRGNCEVEKLLAGAHAEEKK